MARGFRVAPLQPDPGQITIMGPGLELLHLRKDPDRGTWSYTNTSNPTDRGTVDDFMFKHERATLATCVFNWKKSHQLESTLNRIELPVNEDVRGDT